MLREGSGVALVERPRQVRHALRCVFMSGYAEEALERRGFVEGTAPFLRKPFRLEDLAGAVRSALHGAGARG